MYAHTKLERPTATNDTTLTNDQRNKLDNNAMPVRAPTHIARRHAQSPVPPPRAHTYHATKRAALCYIFWPAPPARSLCARTPVLPVRRRPGLRCQQPDLTRQANLCSTQPCTLTATHATHADERHAARLLESPDAVRCKLCFGKACLVLVSDPHTTHYLPHSLSAQPPIPY